MQDFSFISKARQASSAHPACSGPPPHSGPRARGWLTECTDDSMVHHRSGDRLTCSRPPKPTTETFSAPSPTPHPPAGVYVVVHNSHGGIIDLANLHSSASARLPVPPDCMPPPPFPRPSAAPLRKDDLRLQLGPARPAHSRYPPLPLQYTSSTAPSSEHHRRLHPAVADPLCDPPASALRTATQKRRDRQLKAVRAARAQEPHPPDATADKLADLEARLALQEALAKPEAHALPAAPPAAAAPAPSANADAVSAAAPPHHHGPSRPADHDLPAPSSSRKRSRSPQRSRLTPPPRPGSPSHAPSSGSINNFLTDVRERSTTLHHPRHRPRSPRSRSRSRADRSSDHQGRRPHNRRRSTSRSVSRSRSCSSRSRPAHADARPRSDHRYDKGSSSRQLTARRRLPYEPDGRGRQSSSTSSGTGSSPRRRSPTRPRPPALPPPRERRWAPLHPVEPAASPPPPTTPGLTSTRARIEAHQAAVERLSRQDVSASISTPLLTALGAATTPTPSQVDLVTRADTASPPPGGLDPIIDPPSATEVLLGDGYRDHIHTQSPELVPCPPEDGPSMGVLLPDASPAQPALTTADAVPANDVPPRPTTTLNPPANAARPAWKTRLRLKRKHGRGQHRASPVSPPRTGPFARAAHPPRAAPLPEIPRRTVILRFGRP